MDEFVLSNEDERSKHRQIIVREAENLVNVRIVWGTQKAVKNENK